MGIEDSIDPKRMPDIAASKALGLGGPGRPGAGRMRKGTEGSTPASWSGTQNGRKLAMTLSSGETTTDMRLFGALDLRGAGFWLPAPR